ncbi:cellulose biosynthesis protein BcsQ [Kerstersia sp.]|uniref:cellulose biosynthesis protein BcsQ n=1 Tax=Kerstersia sp. TaxID=1930783 RepID=UPI003F8F3032
MKIIAVVSPKGGVGKSTISASLGTSLHRSRRPILFIDLDPQNALRFHLNDYEQRLDGISRATLEKRDWREAVVTTPDKAAVLPYGMVNEDDRRLFERILNSDPNWLRDQIHALPLAEDALVILDTPPGPSAYLRQALSCADLAVVVVLADAASYATLPQMENLIATYCTPRKDFTGYAYLANQFDPQRQLCVDIVATMRNEYSSKPIGIVHHDPAVGEALAHGQSIIDYAPDSAAAQDIKNWTLWVTGSLA